MDIINIIMRSQKVKAINHFCHMLPDTHYLSTSIILESLYHCKLLEHKVPFIYCKCTCKRLQRLISSKIITMFSIDCTESPKL